MHNNNNKNMNNYMKIKILAETKLLELKEGQHHSAKNVLQSSSAPPKLNADPQPWIYVINLQYHV